MNRLVRDAGAPAFFLAWGDAQVLMQRGLDSSVNVDGAVERITSASRASHEERDRAVDEQCAHHVSDGPVVLDHEALEDRPEQRPAGR